METFTDIASLEWIAVRPDVAHQVYGKSLLDAGTRMVLIRVAPGGGFASHRDPYGHLFFFLAGEGVAGVGEAEVPVRPGLVVRIAAGEAHWYRNTGKEDLTLISVNIPQPVTGDQVR